MVGALIAPRSGLSRKAEQTAVEAAFFGAHSEPNREPQIANRDRPLEKRHGSGSTVKHYSSQAVGQVAASLLFFSTLSAAQTAGSWVFNQPVSIHPSPSVQRL
jgi:hypothetical protein